MLKHKHTACARKEVYLKPSNIYRISYLYIFWRCFPVTVAQITRTTRNESLVCVRYLALQLPVVIHATQKAPCSSRIGCKMTRQRRQWWESQMERTHTQTHKHVLWSQVLWEHVLLLVRLIQDVFKYANHPKTISHTVQWYEWFPVVLSEEISSCWGIRSFNLHLPNFRKKPT